MDNDAIFSQINALYSAMTSNKIPIEINKKNNLPSQASLTHAKMSKNMPNVS